MLIEEVASHRPDAVEALGDLAGLDPYYVTTRYPDAVGGGIPGASFFAPEGTLAIERASRRSKDLDDAERLSGLLPLSRAGEKGMP